LSTKKNKLLESAQKNIQKGQFVRAIEEYEAIIKLDPVDIRHRQKLAELMAKANRKDDAIREYTSLAKHYVDSVHYVKAIAVYKQIQKLDAANPEVSLTLASLNEKQGLMGNAIAEYNAALRIFESNGENRKALGVLESLQALDPNNSAIRLRIAEKCYTIGDEAKSLDVFTKLARTLQENGDDNGFNRVTERMVALFPEQASRIMEELGKTPEPEPAPVEPTIISPPPLPPPPTTPQPAPVPPAPLATQQPAVTPPTVEQPPVEEDIEVIEDLVEIEELIEEEEETTTFEHEWEEEIDLDSLVGLAPPVEQEEEATPPEETVELPEVELELEELDLELEIEAGEELTEEADLELPDDAEEALEVDVEEITLPPLEIEAEVATTGQPADGFDLAGELALFADELDFELPQKESGGSPFTADGTEMFKTSDLDQEDAESHYSLGLAYKEMGLFDEAINEFMVAANSPARRIDCLLLQGLCHRDNGDLIRAEEMLSQILQDPAISEDELLSVKYELAGCYELSGDLDTARRLLAEIVTIRPQFSDAASRLDSL
jgi:tetratricopeptide (TPR) repeat protein